MSPRQNRFRDLPLDTLWEITHSNECHDSGKTALRDLLSDTLWDKTYPQIMWCDVTQGQDLSYVV